MLPAHAGQPEAALPLPLPLPLQQQQPQQQRSTVWLAHSMGGLVVKEALLRAAAGCASCGSAAADAGADAGAAAAAAPAGLAAPPPGSCLACSSLCCIFYATPHMSAVQQWLPAKAPPFTAALTSAPENVARNGAFGLLVAALAQQNRLAVLSLGEGMATSLPGVVDGALLPLSFTVVPEDTAWPGYGDFRVLAAANHIDICKACSRQDDRFQLALQHIRKCMRGGSEQV